MNIPYSEVKYMWDHTTYNSWESLRKTIEDQYNNDDYPRYLDKMYKIARYYEFTREPFPESYQDLYEIFNSSSV